MFRYSQMLLLAVLISPLVLSGSLGQGPGKAKGKDDRKEDIAAIKKTMDSFAKAFEKGDAKVVAEHWTPEGEYVSDDGSKFEGREELEKLYGEFFAKHKNLKVEIEMETLRFPSSTTAIEEGYFKLKKSKAGEFATSKYTVLHVKEGGKWLMAVVREWPSAGLTLRDIDWLIGTWEAKRDGVEVTTTYHWDEGKHFILANFTIKEKDRNLKGKQIIAKDSATGGLRSWTFEVEGGFGEAAWHRDGKKWVMEAAGTQPDGSRLTSTNIMTPVDENNFLWQAVDRTLDDEDMPDLPPIKVTRVK